MTFLAPFHFLFYVSPRIGIRMAHNVRKCVVRASQLLEIINFRLAIILNGANCGAMWLPCRWVVGGWVGGEWVVSGWCVAASALPVIMSIIGPRESHDDREFNL